MRVQGLLTRIYYDYKGVGANIPYIFRRIEDGERLCKDLIALGNFYGQIFLCTIFYSEFIGFLYPDRKPFRCPAPRPTPLSDSKLIFSREISAQCYMFPCIYFQPYFRRRPVDLWGNVPTFQTTAVLYKNLGCLNYKELAIVKPKAEYLKLYF